MKKLLLSPSFEGKINTNYISSKFKLKLLLGSFIVMLIYANANAQNYPFALDFSSLNTSTLSSVKNYQVSEGINYHLQDHAYKPIIKLAGTIGRPYQGGVCADGYNGGVPLTDIQLLVKDSVGNIIGTYGQLITGPDGKFEFILNNTGLNFKLIPKKNNGLNWSVTEYDMSLLINHILGRNPLCEPWQRIAADLNYNQKISTSDLLIMQKIMLGYLPPFKENPNLTAWRFIPHQIYNDLQSKPCISNNKQIFFNEYRNLDSVLYTNVYLGFYGIKMGDLDGACIQCSTPATGENETRAISLKNEVQVKDMNLTENENYKIPVYVSNLENLTFLSLGFSNRDLEFESFEVHDGLSTVSKTENNAINFFVNNDQSLRLNSEEPIGYINFRAISNTSLLKNLALNYEILQNKSFDTKGNVFDLTLKPIENSDKKEVFYPNPTIDFVKVNLNKSLLDEFLNISVYTIDGKIVETYQNAKGLELNQIKLLSTLPAGSYIIHIYGNNISQKQLVFKQ